jgi:hypothetical protein
MKRPIKPFVVEVRKGQKSPKKKSLPADLPPVDLFEEQPRGNDALRRAEAALFGAAPKADLTGSGRSGRILETIPDEAPSVEAPPIETKRRGRPPGSRNKAKEIEEVSQEAPAAPKRRGRPPRVLEGAVRKVELTPELANAALESIAKAAVARPVVPIMSARKARAPVSPAKPVREPRQDKAAKILAKQQAKQAKQEAKLTAKLAKQQARETKLTGKQAKPKAPPASAPRQTPIRRPAPVVMAAPAPSARPANPLDTLPRLIRIATETAQGDSAAPIVAMLRPRAGERWRRRLRGAALSAYERRHRKSGAAPR